MPREHWIYPRIFYMSAIKPVFQPGNGTRMTEASLPAASASPDRPLPDAALRALAEAEARRRAGDPLEAKLPPETGGRGGREPVRYGDWEVKGIACDF